MTPARQAEALALVAERSYDATRRYDAAGEHVAGASCIPILLRWRGQPQHLAQLMESWPNLQRKETR